jgi:tetratricopeptide (TPR) repeat protein
VRDDERIDRLLSLFERRRSEGRPLSAEELRELCGPHPEELAEVQRRIALLQAADRMLDLAGDGLHQTVIERPATPDGGAGAADLPAFVGRYAVGPELKQGGMGRIIRVWDEDFKRPLALKTLRGRHPGLEQRLVYEGKGTGCLQHPGIPPVHEPGRLPDGRPYFIMKLIQGASLGELLGRRASPAADLPRFLLIFEQLCAAVGYAHSRGVIHRDLKPGNVMVGAFGEVQVIDWGLAKMLRAAAAAPADEPGTAYGLKQTAAAAGADTTADTVLGTPAYMPPEQARGELAGLDARADVFGLGAILCEVLTGSPPYQGRTTPEVYARARHADLAEAQARLAGCGADGELADLARACLTADRDGRPADGAAVAGAVAAYRQAVQQRLRATEIAAATAAARAEEEKKLRVAERRRRRAVVALAAAVAVVLLGAAAVGFWYQQQRALRARYLNREVGSALAEADAALAALHHHLDDPQRAHALVSDPERWRAEVQAVEAGRQRAVTLAAGGEDLLEADAAARLARLKVRLDAEQNAWALARTLDEVRLKASSRKPEEDWLLDLGVADREYPGVLAAAGLDVVHGEAGALAARVAASPARYALVATLDHWALATADERLRGKLLEVARRADPDGWRDQVRDARVWGDRDGLQQLAAAARVADQSPTLLVVLAILLKKQGGAREELLRQALLHHPRDFWLYFLLGSDATDPGEQIAHYQAALAVRPGNGYAHTNLGLALYRRQDVAGAVAHYRRAIALHPGLARPHVNLGNVLRSRKDWKGGLEHYRKAVALDPRSALAHNNLGNALYDQKDVPGAIDHYRKAIELDPRYGLAHVNLGNVLRARQELNEAIACYQDAIRHNPGYATAHYYLGLALHQQQDTERAVGHFRKAIDLKLDNALVHADLGLALLEQGQFAKALEATRRCLELLPADDPVRPRVEQQQRTCEKLLAEDRKLDAYLGRGELPERVEDVLALIELCRTHKHYPAAAARLYAAAFAAEPALGQETDRGHRFLAARCALLAAAGQGRDPVPPAFEDRAKLRGQALAWLRADLDQLQRRVQARDGKALPGVVHGLPAWQREPALAPVRGDKARANLPADEQPAWLQLWTEVEQLLIRVATDVRTVTFAGTLTRDEQERVHEVKLQAGRVYLIDLESRQFDTCLRLHDDKGKVLAENDDVAPDNLNSRLLFTAPADGTYRVVVTSFEKHDTGAYTLMVRSFVEAKK